MPRLTIAQRLPVYIYKRTPPPTKLWGGVGGIQRWADADHLRQRCMRYTLASRLEAKGRSRLQRLAQTKTPPSQFFPPGTEHILLAARQDAKSRSPMKLAKPNRHPLPARLKP